MLNNDLFEEHRDSIRRVHPDVSENFFGIGLQLLIHPRIYVSCFSHMHQCITYVLRCKEPRGLAEASPELACLDDEAAHGFFVLALQEKLGGQTVVEQLLGSFRREARTQEFFRKRYILRDKSP